MIFNREETNNLRLVCAVCWVCWIRLGTLVQANLTKKKVVVVLRKNTKMFLHVAHWFWTYRHYSQGQEPLKKAGSEAFVSKYYTRWFICRYSTDKSVWKRGKQTATKSRWIFYFTSLLYLCRLREDMFTPCFPLVYSF